MNNYKLQNKQSTIYSLIRSVDSQEVLSDSGEEYMEKGVEGELHWLVVYFKKNVNVMPYKLFILKFYFCSLYRC